MCIRDSLTSTQLRMRRPELFPWQYLIMSPRGSGGTWHTDPPQTGFWNALVSGKKHWVLADPSQTLELPFREWAGIKEQVEAREWFEQQHREWTRRVREEGSRLWECVQHAGDMVYTPVGWGHTALALEDGVGVSEQVVSAAGLLPYLRHHSWRVQRLCADLRVHAKSKLLDVLLFPVICARALEVRGLRWPGRAQELGKLCWEHIDKCGSEVYEVLIGAMIKDEQEAQLVKSSRHKILRHQREQTSRMSQHHEL
eukprot:TRINITY_DN37158_c0_g1_i1.p2 TRINITY_DN37158_c0_g1~~TRINITY_DN37158_c0_g1_i1.p2  ORF type:complete len:255 (+),score=45.20 TRINITY_DN37158_c0_g1_i1:121-885(+)